MSITFSGVYSGMDTGAIIDQLVNLERAPIYQLDKDKSNFTSQLGIIQSVNSKLQALQTKAEDLTTIGDFLSYSATSSDTDTVTSTATGEAVPGTYQIEVTQLATAERTYSTAFDDSDVEGGAGTGTLSITVGSEDAVDIEIASDDTLESIVGLINASDAQVTAGLFYDGSQYRIQITGIETGADNAISFTEDAGVSLDLDVATAYQEAVDATLTIDGFAITSSNNIIEDALTGVTVTLEDVTESAVNIVVAPDSTAIQSDIEGLVSSYNEIMNMIHSEFAYTGEAKGQDRLAGDSTLRSLQTQLSGIISSSVDDLGTTYSSLSQLGISTNTDGTLTIDKTELADAIASDAVGVGRLFSGTADHTVDGIADQLDDLVDTFIDYSDGILTAKTAGINSRIDVIDDTILRYESRIGDFESRLRKEFTQMEIMMSTLSSQSNYLMGMMS